MGSVGPGTQLDSLFIVAAIDIEWQQKNGKVSRTRHSGGKGGERRGGGRRMGTEGEGWAMGSHFCNLLVCSIHSSKHDVLSETLQVSQGADLLHACLQRRLPAVRHVASSSSKKASAGTVAAAGSLKSRKQKTSIRGTVAVP